MDSLAVVQAQEHNRRWKAKTLSSTMRKQEWGLRQCPLTPFLANLLLDSNSSSSSHCSSPRVHLKTLKSVQLSIILKIIIAAEAQSPLQFQKLLFVTITTHQPQLFSLHLKIHQLLSVHVQNNLFYRIQFLGLLMISN
jgi:hypothetical protein